MIGFADRDYSAHFLVISIEVFLNSVAKVWISRQVRKSRGCSATIMITSGSGKNSVVFVYIINLTFSDYN